MCFLPGFPLLALNAVWVFNFFGRVSGVVLFPVFEVTVQVTYISDFPRFFHCDEWFCVLSLRGAYGVIGCRPSEVKIAFIIAREEIM